MSTPEKDTPEWRLWVAALDAAIWPPYADETRGAECLVPSFVIDQLREAFEELGIDWRATKAQNDSDRKDRKREQQALRTRATIAAQVSPLGE
jgi:hypothetical protein